SGRMTRGSSRSSVARAKGRSGPASQAASGTVSPRFTRRRMGGGTRSATALRSTRLVARPRTLCSTGRRQANSTSRWSRYGARPRRPIGLLEEATEEVAHGGVALRRAQRGRGGRDGPPHGGGEARVAGRERPARIGRVAGEELVRPLADQHRLHVRAREAGEE